MCGTAIVEHLREERRHGRRVHLEAGLFVCASSELQRVTVVVQVADVLVDQAE